MTWNWAWCSRHPREVSGFRRGERVFYGFALLALVASASACASDVESSNSEVEGYAADRGALQPEVDTLLRTSVRFESSVAPARLAALGARYERLVDLVGDVASAWSELETGNDEAALDRLSTLAGQIPVQVARLKRDLRTAGGSDAAELSRRLSQLQWAARSLGVAVRDQQYRQRALQTGTLSAGEVAAVETLNGPLAPGAGWYVLSEGHADLVDVAYEDGELGISIHDDSVEPGVERDPGQTILVVKSAARTQVPDERFAFLGPVGSDVWILPQGQLDAEAAGLIWPGISTEEIEPGVFVGDQVQIRLRDVLGPNGFSIFESPDDETTPPTILADSEDGLPDTVTTSVSTHRHANWAFESPGLYVARVQARARLAGVSGNPWVASPSALLKFVVLP